MPDFKENTFVMSSYPPKTIVQKHILSSLADGLWKICPGLKSRLALVNLLNSDVRVAFFVT